MTTTIYNDTTALVRKVRRHTMDENGRAIERRGLRVESDVRELRPWLDSFDSGKAALTELHATMLRLATNCDVAYVPEDMTVPAAVLFGLTRAVQQGSPAHGRTVTVETALRCVAHVLAAVHTPAHQPNRSRHLDMARSWMAQAYLDAGVEAGAS